MWEYYQKLWELLKEVPEIKKDLEELRFWTDLFYKNWKEWINHHETYIWMSHPYNWTNSQPIIKNYHNYCIWSNFSIKQLKELYKINNPIEERHIRMYCEKIKENTIINTNLDTLWVFFIWNCVIRLDNSKPFHQQDEEVYKQLYEYFISLKN